MPIKFTCPNCQKKIGAPDAAAGRKGKCPQCQAPIDVPKEEPLVELTVVDDPKPAAKADMNQELKKAVSQLSPRNRAVLVVGGVLVVLFVIAMASGGGKTQPPPISPLPQMGSNPSPAPAPVPTPAHTPAPAPAPTTDPSPAHAAASPKQVLPKEQPKVAAQEAQAELDEKAEIAARSLVLKKLRSPSTAEFVSSKILDRKPPRYIVYVVVDAQNAFGATIRNDFLTCIELRGGDKYAYDKDTGIQGAGFLRTDDDSMKADALKLFKLTNDWDPKPESQKAETKTLKSDTPPLDKYEFMTVKGIAMEVNKLMSGQGATAEAYWEMAYRYILTDQASIGAMQINNTRLYRRVNGECQKALLALCKKLELHVFTEQEDAAEESKTQATKPEPADQSKTVVDSKSTESNRAKLLLSMAKQFIKNHQMASAKDYANKIIKDFPDSKEAEEARAILKLKE